MRSGASGEHVAGREPHEAPAAQRRSGASASQCAPGSAAEREPERRARLAALGRGDAAATLAVELDRRGEQQHVALERREPESAGRARRRGAVVGSGRGASAGPRPRSSAAIRASSATSGTRAAPRRARSPSSSACRHAHGTATDCARVERRRLGGAVDEQGSRRRRPSSRTHCGAGRTSPSWNVSVDVGVACGSASAVSPPSVERRLLRRAAPRARRRA